MKKKTVLGHAVGLSVLVALLSCTQKPKSQDFQNGISDLQQNSFVQKSHKWYYFKNDSFEQIDMPQNAPQILERPWTEAVRIASAASVPQGTVASPFDAYAVVNHCGILAFKGDSITLCSDNAIFPAVTADSLVFSKGIPVFYLYRSSFFNEAIDSLDSGRSAVALELRPFLVEFNPLTRIFYPLVSYKNLNLSDDDEITGYFWDGTTWTCSSKRISNNQVEFKYFLWQPLVELTELSPAFSSDYYIFKNASEAEYRALNMPHLFNDAPVDLKSLLASIPSGFSFYVSWRDGSGTSPVSYYQPGNNSSSVNAKGISRTESGYDAVVFADGTTYLRLNATGAIYAFRLPLLPAGYSYGELAIAGETLYVAWEENNFYKTGRSGFIQIDMAQVISTVLN